MISIVITAFNEPSTIGKAIDSIISQKIREKYELIVSAPDRKTQDIVKKYSKKFRQIKLFKDPGKGKSYALNLIFPKIKGRIAILTDGDVYISENSINELLNFFNDSKMGCVSGRPVPTNSKSIMLGFWAHLLYDAGAHKIRKELYDAKKFLECSAYLFAFRTKMVKKIPLDTAEDAYIPYYFWNNGYKIGYADKALVYVKNPDNFKDWLNQRIRTANAHENLGKYVDVKKVSRVKSFSNEIKKGLFWALSYPKTLKEYFWTFTLFVARIYMWILVFYNIKIKRQYYKDGWKRIESTK